MRLVMSTASDFVHEKLKWLNQRNVRTISSYLQIVQNLIREGIFNRWQNAVFPDSSVAKDLWHCNIAGSVSRCKADARFIPKSGFHNTRISYLHVVVEYRHRCPRVDTISVSGTFLRTVRVVVERYNPSRSHTCASLPNTAFSSKWLPMQYSWLKDVWSGYSYTLPQNEDASGREVNSASSTAG